MQWILQILWLLIMAMSVTAFPSGAEGLGENHWIKITTVGDVAVSYWIVGAVSFYAWHRLFDFFLSSFQALSTSSFSRWGQRNFGFWGIWIITIPFYPFIVLPFVYFIESTGIHLHYIFMPFWYFSYDFAVYEYLWKL